MDEVWPRDDANARYIFLNIEDIRFSAGSVRDHFGGTDPDPDISIFEMAVAIVLNEKKVNDFLIDVVEYKNHFYAANNEDNECLYMLKVYNDIKKQTWDVRPEHFRVRCKLVEEQIEFTTKNCGQSADLKRPTHISFAATGPEPPPKKTCIAKEDWFFLEEPTTNVAEPCKTRKQMAFYSIGLSEINDEHYEATETDVIEFIKNV